MKQDADPATDTNALDQGSPEATRPPKASRLRRADVRIFSSASDAPLARRPTDVVLLLLCVLGVLILAIPAPGPTVLDTTVGNLVTELPGLVGWFWQIAYNLLIAWAAVLLLVALVTHGRKRLLAHELLAGVLAFGFAMLAGRASGTDLTTSLRAVGSSQPPAVYLAVRLAIATAIVVMASPHMSRPLRFVGRWVVLTGAVAGIALGVTLPIGMIAGALIGLGSAAIVHLAFGSPAGRLTLDQIALALADLDVEATDLRHAPLEPRGAGLATATDPDGRALQVKVYGRDARDGQLLLSTWSSIWHRGETPHIGAGRLQQVEHEAFLTLMAERGGVAVLPVVAAGMADGRDAVLVTEISGRPLRSLGPEEISDEILTDVWKDVVRLGELGIAHGPIDGDTIVIRPDGHPAIGNFGGAKVAATDAAMMTDRAQLLVTTALLVGHARAVSAAAQVLDADGLARVIPFVQPAVLDRATRRAVHDAPWELDEVRDLAASTAGVDPPKLEQVRRVTVGSVVKVVLIGLLAYWLIASLAGVDITQIVDELKSADTVWLWAALAMVPFVQVAQAFSTMGASLLPVRFIPVLMLEYAIQFIGLAVPSSAARVALEIRFFQRQGADVGGAASIGLIDSVCGFAIEMVLILVITLTGLATLTRPSSSSSSTSSSSSSGGVSVWILLVVLLVLAVVITLAVPRYRAMIKEAVPRYRGMLREQASSARTALRVLRQPTNVSMLLGGNLVAQLLLAIILGLCLKAFGYSATLSQLILVNTIVSLFAGFMPVPGGMGVAEAGYTAGLQAIGVPSAAAVSTAIAFRLVTFYLPPLWGAVSMRWLRRHEFV